jgi:hypothetical protein
MNMCLTGTTVDADCIPCTCARGSRVIIVVVVVIVVSTTITIISRSIGTQLSDLYAQRFWQKTGFSICFKLRDTIHERHK